MGKARQGSNGGTATVENEDRNLLDKILSSQEGRDAVNHAVAKRLEIDNRVKYEYVPVGQRESIVVTTERTLRNCVKPTVRGEMPSRIVVEEFNQTCAQLRLNPYMKDVYLVGYDGRDNAPANWSIITSIHALEKRADLNPSFDGMEAGLVVEDKSGATMEVTGTAHGSGWSIVGAWARVFRKDRRNPTYVSVQLKERAKNYGEWKNQLAWMIVKCARAAALREAFPNDVPMVMMQDEVDLRRLLDDAVDETEKKRKTPPTSPAAALMGDGQPAADTTNRFRAELAADLRRTSNLKDVDSVSNQYTKRAAGDMERLEIVALKCEARRNELAPPPDSSLDEPPVARRPETPDEEHGDAYEEDLAAIEEQAARES